MTTSTDGKDPIISDPTIIAIRLVKLHTALHRTVMLCKDWQKNCAESPSKAFDNVWPSLNLELGKIYQLSHDENFPHTLDTLVENYSHVDKQDIRKAIDDLLETTLLLDGIVDIRTIGAYPIPDEEDKEEWLDKISSFARSYFSAYNAAGRTFQNATNAKIFPWITPVRPPVIDVNINIAQAATGALGEPYL